MALDTSNIKSDYIKKDGVFNLTPMRVEDLSQAEINALNQSDRHQIMGDGTIVFLDNDGSTQIIPKSKTDPSTVDLSLVDSEAIKKAADVVYLSMTTGVSSAEMNTVYESLGIDPNATNAHSLRDSILGAAGYSQGSTSDYYGTNEGPSDAGAAILYERNKQQPTEEQIIAAGLDPSQVSVVNSNAANIAYLRQEMLRSGNPLDSTLGITNLTGIGGGNLSPFGQTGVSNIAEIRALNDYNKNIYGANNPNFKSSAQSLDIFEWDLEPSGQGSGGTGGTGSGGTDGTINIDGGGGGTGGGTGSGDGVSPGGSGAIGGTGFTSTPTISTVTPVYDQGKTGVSEVTMPDYTGGITNQEAAFTAREAESKKLYKPQTIAEQEDAGTAPAFENVMYRNRFGQTQIIQHINGQPSQPIPIGYTRVQGFGTQTQGTQTQGTQTQSQYQGGIIQGFSDANSEQESQIDETTTPAPTVNQPLNFQPGGEVEEQEDGGFKIKYPDGTFSQTYDTAENAGMANQAGLSSLGLPDYTTYLEQQGVNTDLPGYDQTAYQAAYQTYITDPNTLTAIQQAAAAANVQPETGTINQEISQEQKEITEADVDQAQKDLVGQAFINPAGAIAASPVSYLDPNAAGTVMESDTGAALPTAPIITDDQVAQIDKASTADMPTKTGAGQYDANQATAAVKKAVDGLQEPIKTSAAEAGFIPPPPDAPVTQAIERFFNPTTGQEVTVMTGGYTVPEGFQKVGAGVDLKEAFPDTFTKGMTAAQGSVTKSVTGEVQERQKIDPATNKPMFDANGNPIMEAYTGVSDLDAATSSSVDVTGAPTRTMETGEKISEDDPTGVDQTRIDEELKKSEAASVKDELDTLLGEFESGNTPAWAKGAMRRAQQELAARGISSSSMAGEAVVQAMIEASLPIASIDASNKQAMALEKARQRATFLGQEFDQAYQTKVTNAAKVSEIANINFTAQQQIALENSKASNTMALQNLSNEQALVMAEAAQISQLEITNLNNRQKAQVENAQNFLQMDMANLEAEQQTTLFKQQSVVNTILSDQAATNAAKQFNAANQQQNDQFFANLGASVGQFNAAQLNAVKQFNADSVNSVLEFNSKIQNQRELFNAQNALVVAQANAQWRQNTQTLNTAAANESNMEYTRLLNGLTMTTLDEILQRERDTLSMAFQISENSANRANAIVLEKLAADATLDAATLQAELDASASAGDFLKEVFLKILDL